MVRFLSNDLREPGVAAVLDDGLNQAGNSGGSIFPTARSDGEPHAEQLFV